MSNGKIFLIDEGAETVREMSEKPYESEEILQRLLATTPDLLPGDQINPEAPRNWLLVKRELGIRDDIYSGDRWSLDHLFLDQDGIPTFVECKRSSDSRARREVVAQMLDYAANGLKHWTVDNLRQAATETAAVGRKSLDREVERLIGSGAEDQIENYWKTVEQNLRDGKARLIFVADKVPAELKRLVEFLNEKMTDVEVLAIEVSQYMGEGLRAIVPRVIGLTEKSREVKSTSTRKRSLSRDQFLTKCSKEAIPVFGKILEESDRRGFITYWGTVGFSIRAHVATEKHENASFIYCWPEKTLEIFLGQLPLTPDDCQAVRNDLLGLDIFQEAGDWTLRSFVDEKTASKVWEACQLIFNKAQNLVKAG